MIKLLFKIPAVQRYALKYAAKHQQIKPLGFDALEYRFTDNEGRKYYHFAKLFDLPLDRLSEIEVTLSEMQAGLSYEEKKDVYGHMHKVLEKFIASIRGNKFDTKALGQFTLLIEESNRREQLLIHRDLMYKMMALVYVREDENIHTVDAQLLKEKVKYFQQEIEQGGNLSSFFGSQTFSALLPWSTLSENELQRQFQIANSEIVRLTTLLGTLSTEGELQSK